ncbi:hypothetical protein DF016_10965 [Burkholderia stagnalis]|uniref:Uncharacterized protein n=1 Tax=Burkholderia stagnalis TaxID=1503054 RepID=A0ABX9YR24_9BURK|nr:MULTISPECIES: hypothetical protein [Burkholderia]MDD1494102.1 hypothetical protein [Burkholderia thailandensis]RQY93848.1 hypothetical protein DF017_12545 [Burkholderia stagnalis]RQZ19570.1 hypothetical protein DF016_10965 [Burkholderia stagnalis]
MAHDRADQVALSKWLDARRERLLEDAGQLVVELDLAWTRFTQEAADEAGRIRQAETASRKQAGRND